MLQICGSAGYSITIHVQTANYILGGNLTTAHRFYLSMNMLDVHKHTYPLQYGACP